MFNIKPKSLFLMITIVIVLILLVVSFRLFSNKKEVKYTYLSSPQISANNQVAYIKGDNLFVSNIDGTEMKQLTTFPVPVFDAKALRQKKIEYFEWSPDGNKIAYVNISVHPDKFTRTGLITIIDTKKFTVFNTLSLPVVHWIGGLCIPMHWYDNSHLLIQEPENLLDQKNRIFKLYLFNIYSKEKELITERSEGIIDFAFSPDKRYLAFTDGVTNSVDLYVRDVIQGATQLIDYDYGDLEKLSWSHSGQYLVYEVFSLGEFVFTFIYDIKDKVDIQSNPEGGYSGERKSFDLWRDIEAFKEKEHTFNIHYDKWLKNDKLVFIIAEKSDRNDRTVWVLDAIEKKPQQIIKFPEDIPSKFQEDKIGEIAVSPDFTKIIFSTSLAPDYQKQTIYSVNIDGRDLKEIANNEL